MHHERRPYYTVTASSFATDQLTLALQPAAEADIMGFSQVQLSWEPAGAVRRRRALSEKSRALLLTKDFSNPFDVNYNGAGGAASSRLNMALGFYCQDCYMHWGVALRVELAFCLLARSSAAAYYVGWDTTNLRADGKQANGDMWSAIPGFTPVLPPDCAVTSTAGPVAFNLGYKLKVQLTGSAALGVGLGFDGFEGSATTCPDGSSNVDRESCEVNVVSMSNVSISLASAGIPITIVVSGGLRAGASVSAKVQGTVRAGASVAISDINVGGRLSSSGVTSGLSTEFYKQFTPSLTMVKPVFQMVAMSASVGLRLRPYIVVSAWNALSVSSDVAVAGALRVAQGTAVLASPASTPAATPAAGASPSSTPAATPAAGAPSASRSPVAASSAPASSSSGGGGRGGAGGCTTAATIPQPAGAPGIRCYVGDNSITGTTPALSSRLFDFCYAASTSGSFGITRFYGGASSPSHTTYVTEASYLSPILCNTQGCNNPTTASSCVSGRRLQSSTWANPTSEAVCPSNQNFFSATFSSSMNAKVLGVTRRDLFNALAQGVVMPQDAINYVNQNGLTYVDNSAAWNTITERGNGGSNTGSICVDIGLPGQPPSAAAGFPVGAIIGIIVGVLVLGGAVAAVLSRRGAQAATSVGALSGGVGGVGVGCTMQSAWLGDSPSHPPSYRPPTHHTVTPRLVASASARKREPPPCNRRLPVATQPNVPCGWQRGAWGDGGWEQVGWSRGGAGGGLHVSGFHVIQANMTTYSSLYTLPPSQWRMATCRQTASTTQSCRMSSMLSTRTSPPSGRSTLTKAATPISSPRVAHPSCGTSREPSPASW